MSVLINKDLSHQGGLSLSLEDIFKDAFRKLKASLNQVAQFKVPMVYFKSQEKHKSVVKVEDNIPHFGNEALDMYYLEGMKLFNQGPYADRVKPRKDGELE